MAVYLSDFYKLEAEIRVMDGSIWPLAPPSQHQQSLIKRCVEGEKSSKKEREKREETERIKRKKGRKRAQLIGLRIKV